MSRPSDKAVNWCGECGLHLLADTPPTVWTGHVHRPVSEEVLAAAATVWAVGRAIGANSPALRKIEAAGVSRQAAEMYQAEVAHDQRGTG